MIPIQPTVADSSQVPRESVWRCFLVLGESRVPVSRLRLHDMVLSGELDADAMVAVEAGGEPRPLRHLPELVPFQDLRRLLLRRYRQRNHADALRLARRFQEFDTAGRQPERVDALFLDALLMERTDPRRAADLYFRVVAFGDHYLVPVAHNNLAVLYGREGDAEAAWEHVCSASRVDPAPVAALINAETLLLRIDVARRRGRVPMIDVAAELEKVRARLERVKKDSGKRRGFGQLTSELVLPAEECATLLRDEDLPDSFGFPSVPQLQRIIARRYLESAHRALADGRPESAEDLASHARNHDPAVEDEAARIIAHSQVELAERKHADEQRRHQMAMERVDIAERDGRLDEAMQLLSPLLAIGRSEYADRLEDLRRRLARKQLDHGRELQDRDPRVAAEWLEQAARTDAGCEPEARACLAVLRWRDVEPRFAAAFELRDFAAATACIREIQQFADLPAFADRAPSMQRKLDESRGRMALEAAEAALQQKDATGRADARRFAVEAEHHDSRLRVRARKIRDAVDGLELQSEVAEVRARLAERKFDDAEKAIDAIAGRIPGCEEAVGLRRQLLAHREAARQQEFQSQIKQAWQYLAVADLQQARNHLDAALALDAHHGGIGRLRERLQVAERRREIRALLTDSKKLVADVAADLRERFAEHVADVAAVVEELFTEGASGPDAGEIGKVAAETLELLWTRQLDEAAERFVDVFRRAATVPPIAILTELVVLELRSETEKLARKSTPEAVRRVKEARASIEGVLPDLKEQLGPPVEIPRPASRPTSPEVIDPPKRGIVKRLMSRFRSQR